MYDEDTQLVEIVNGDEIAVHPDAPEEFKEWFASNADRAAFIIEFGMMVEAAGHDPLEREPLDARELAKYHRAECDKAVEEGNLERAQEHKEYADYFKEAVNRYTEVLQDG